MSGSPTDPADLRRVNTIVELFPADLADLRRVNTIVELFPADHRRIVSRRFTQSKYHDCVKTKS